MVYHWRPGWLPGGFTGVDLFFVISGFVVSLSLPAGAPRGVRGLAGFFYARRAVRILPALYAALFASVLFGVLFIPPAWLSAAAEQTGLAAFWGYSNVVLARTEGGYFAPQADYNLFTHTWSLGVEEQFYLVFPLLFAAWRAGRRTLSASSFAGLGAASLVWAAVAAGSPAAFYGVAARFWQLALGVLAFQAGVRPMPGAVPALGVAAIGAGFMLASPGGTPWPDSVGPALAAAILLVAIRVAALPRWLAAALSAAPVRWVGRRSYSLYLWHWPVLVAARWTVGAERWWAAAVALPLTVLISHLSYRFVESPPRRALARGALRPRAVLVLAALAVALGRPAAHALWHARNVLSFSTVVRHRADWYPDTLVDRRGADGCVVRPALLPADGTDSFVWRRTGCGPAPVAGAPALFVIGDSHAAAEEALVSAYVAATGAPAWLAVRGGCPLLGPPIDKPVECHTFLRQAFAHVADAARPGDVLFLPGLRLARLAQPFARHGEAAARAAMVSMAAVRWRADETTFAVPLLRALAARGVATLLEAPKPVMPAPAFRCADWFDRGNPVCADGDRIPRATIAALRAPVLAQFGDVVGAVPEVRVWDPLPLLCPGAVCETYRGGRPLYFDADHLSGFGNRVLEGDFVMAVLAHRG